MNYILFMLLVAITICIIGLAVNIWQLLNEIKKEVEKINKIDINMGTYSGGKTFKFNNEIETSKATPKKPLYKHYNPRDFETIGKCPNCGRNVYKYIVGAEEKCECGQLLDWGE